MIRMIRDRNQDLFLRFFHHVKTATVANKTHSHNRCINLYLVIICWIMHALVLRYLHCCFCTTSWSTMFFSHSFDEISIRLLPWLILSIRSILWPNELDCSPNPNIDLFISIDNFLVTLWSLWQESWIWPFWFHTIVNNSRLFEPIVWQSSSSLQVNQIWHIRVLWMAHNSGKKGNTTCTRKYTRN